MSNLATLRAEADAALANARVAIGEQRPDDVIERLCNVAYEALRKHAKARDASLRN